MKLPCDCCEGPHVLTPLPTDNSPGLSKLRYRAGTHTTFFETMQARLSSANFPELAALKTRERSDPAMALLDVWATVGDVLTFYQERIANEGYLRTATERRSILEQARLVGYRLRPGVAASTYLAYTIENDRPPVEIPQGARVNSIPAPGEQMQAFETSEPLMARHEWNALKPRMAQPQTRESIKAKNRLYLRGTATNLKPNDALLIDWGEKQEQELEPAPFRVYKAVEPDTKADRTLVTLYKWEETRIDDETETPDTNVSIFFGQSLEKLKKSPSIPPVNATQLPRSPQRTFSARADVFAKLMSTHSPHLGSTLYPALHNAEVTKNPGIKICAPRIKASLFGHNAPEQPEFDSNGKVTGYIHPNLRHMWESVLPADSDKSLSIIALDADYGNIRQDSWIIIERPPLKNNQNPLIRSHTLRKVTKIQTLTMAGLGISGKVSLLSVQVPWLTKKEAKSLWDSTPLLRETIVYTGSELLDLAQEPIQEKICGSEIELDRLFDGLEPGRWMIVSGERTDIPGTSGVMASELVMLSEVTQKTQTVSASDTAGSNGAIAPNEGMTKGVQPGDKLHTFIKFDKDLAYCYKRDTVTIYANVVKATHGETRSEVLGSGDASQAFQSFELKQFPVTYVSAPTASGIESTLEMSVNDIKWHEAANLATLGERDRKFITFRDDDEKTSITFGNGERGARLPTGQENIRAVYRSGIGKPGNVLASQISLLGTRPLGVKAVINPIRASGGADKEGRDQARKNVPLALLALDRLVSTSDYADFTRTFAGIGKATAVRSTTGHQPFVQVTIAGAEDIPLEETSDLYRNLSTALHRYGDPQVPIRIRIRERLALVVSANVRIHPDYLWEILEPKIRLAMLDAFSFEKLELGEDLLLAEAVRVIQYIHGVVYVDMDVFDTLSETDLLDGFSAPPVAEQNGEEETEGETAAAVALKLLHRIPIEANQLAYLAPEVPDTLILQEIKT